MADADKGNIEVINGSIGDLIFRIETLTSDRDTIKVCVRAANELTAMQTTIARLTAANESMQEDAVQNTYAFGQMLHANKEQAEEIKTLKQMLEACALYLNHPDVKEIPFAMRSEVLGDKITAMLEEK